MKNLLLAVFVLFICGHIYSQTWQPMGVPEGSGVTDLVYWSGGGAVFGDKLWATTGSVDWPTGQRGGVFYSATSGTYQGIWYRSGGSAGYYIGRTLEVGQDGKLYASLWRDPAIFPADALCRFEPAAGIFGFLYQAQAGDNIFSIAVKNNPHTIFGGTRNGVIRSTDNGTTFGYSNTGIPDSAWVYDIAIDSSGILAVASSKGVFISTNNGDNWLTIIGIPPEDTAKTLLFINDTTSAGLQNKETSIHEHYLELVMGTDNGWWGLFTGREQLQLIAFYLFGDVEQSDIAVRYIFENQRRLYASLFPSFFVKNNISKMGDMIGVYESTDDGVSWNPINDGLPPNPPVSALAIQEYFTTYFELYAGLFNDTTNGAGIYKLGITVDVEETDNEIPSKYLLEQNYPNPFNPSTSIQYAISNLPDGKAGRQFVTLKVYDVLGNEIATLVNEEKPAGSYEVKFESSGLSSGVYFYKLKAGSFVETKKMILLR
jgi:hypothetical protein